jgi:hypothetical protein
MFKTTIAIGTFLCMAQLASAQLVSLPSGNVGIGTLAPTHQFHTTGSVRLQAMTGTGNRLLQTDATGLLAPVTGGTVGQVLTQGATGLTWATPAAATANAWNLTCNTANTAAHFFGTTDNQAIIVKTAGVERFRIRPQNNSTFLMSNNPNPVGTWDSDPNAAVTGVSMEIQRMPITYGASVGLSSTTSAVNGISTSGSASSGLSLVGSWYAAGQIVGIGGGATISKLAQVYKVYPNGGGVFGVDLQNATITNAMPTECFVGGVVTSLTGEIASSQNTIFAALIGEDKINTNLTWAAYLKGRTYISGNLAVGTTAPTAQLHTVGAVRHQNLPTGTGKVLVADADGNIFVSNSVAQIAPNNATSSQIEAQNEEIKDLKARLERLEKLLTVTQSASKGDEKVILEQNRPNPFDNTTIIGYELPANYAQATLNISDLSGKTVYTELLTQPKGEVEIKSNTLKDGIYMYSLVANGKVLKTAKMIVAKN